MHVVGKLKPAVAKKQRTADFLQNATLESVGEIFHERRVPGFGMLVCRDQPLGVFGQAAAAGPLSTSGDCHALFIASTASHAAL